MMSSICLAKTAVSFGAAASAMRTQPANGAAAAPASNRRLVISVMVRSPFGSRLAAVCRIHAVYRDMAAACETRRCRLCVVGHQASLGRAILHFGSYSTLVEASTSSLRPDSNLRSLETRRIQLEASALSFLHPLRPS